MIRLTYLREWSFGKYRKKGIERFMNNMQSDFNERVIENFNDHIIQCHASLSGHIQGINFTLKSEVGTTNYNCKKKKLIFEKIYVFFCVF